MTSTDVGRSRAAGTDEPPWWRAGLGARLLVGLLAVDTVLVVLWRLYEAGVLTDRVFALWSSDGLAQWWGEASLAVSVVALLVLLVRHRAVVFLALAALLSWVLVEQLFDVSHERGRALSRAGVHGRFGLTSVPWNALVTLVSVTVPLLVVLGVCLLLTRRPEPRRIAWAVTGLVALLGACAFGVDLVARLVGGAPGLFTLVEEGGELVATSLLAAYTVVVAARPVAARPPGWLPTRTVPTES